MRGRASRLLHGLALAWSLALASIAHAAPPDPKAREEVAAEIRGFAERHADAGTLKTEFVVEQFRGNRAGLAPLEVARIYEEAYAARKAATKPGPWDDYRLSIATIAAILAALVAIFRKWIDEVVGKGLKLVGGFFYERFAGNRLLRRLALKKYRKGLVDNFQLLKIPFRPGRPLKMSEVYVPLKAAEAREDEGHARHRPEVDAFEALAKHAKIVVVGAPGSGKSMLLKHIALAYAEGRLPPIAGAPIPVLVELHRLSDGKATIEEQVVAELGRTGFPHAETFVARNLEEARLLLLLDGLDEVPTAQRARVCQLVKDLVHKHLGIRLVVTCRKQVYRSDLDEIADQKLELVDFSDAQIQRFLRSWAPSMPPGKSVDQLLKALAERPQIKTLAGNPLLLTIIAYLYTDTDLVLPHSRSEFYRKSTDTLLDNWHVEQNTFAAPAKRAILEHLALFNQEGGDPKDQDRRTIDFRVVKREVAELCPSLNVKPEDALRIIDEIVERSGLLLRLDKGQRYGFAHLTVQEFFTAARLVAEPEKLIERFAKDPDRWRETVKLWCGLAGDATEVIRAVHDTEPVTAFECLADAQKVSPELSDALVAEMKTRLVQGGEAIQKAFGFVAADPRPRGQEVFGFLVECLEEPKLREPAAGALARTNLTRAAEVLRDRAQEGAGEIRAALVAMGDLAVPSLAWLVANGGPWAVDDLRKIGTPRAAEILAGLLWSETPGMALGAALALGSALMDPAIEAALREYPLTQQQRASKEWIDWVWKPFEEPATSALPIIVGRIAHRIDMTWPNELRSTAIDPRLIIPLCVAQMAREPWLIERETLLKVARQRLAPTDRPKSLPRKIDLRNNEGFLFIHPEQESDFVATVLDAARLTPKLRAFFHAMPAQTRFELVARLLRWERRPSKEDWLNICRPVEYAMGTGWHLRLVSLLGVILCIPAVVHVLHLLSRSPLWQSAYFVTWGVAGRAAGHAAAGLMLLVEVVCGLVFAARWPRDDDGDDNIAGILGPVLPYLAAAITYAESVRHKHFYERWIVPILLLATIVIGGWVVLPAYFGNELLFPFLGTSYLATYSGVILPCNVTLCVIAYRRHRASQNPLHGILDPPSPQPPPQPAAAPSPPPPARAA